MCSRKCILILLIFLFFTNLSRAESLGDQFKSDLASPFKSNAVNVFYVGGSLTLVSLLFKDRIKNKLQPDVAEDRPLKRTSKYFELMGRAIPNAVYFVYMGSDYLINNDFTSLERAKLMFKASLYSGLITDISKYTFNEKRPNGGKYSFPSGHTTEIFAFASTIIMEHSFYYGIGAGLIALGTGFSRMNDNAHYLHDVIAGATIGAMYGVGLCYKNRSSEKNKNDIVGFVTPIDNGIQTYFAISF